MSTFYFAQHVIKASAVFLQTELSFTLVNRKPVVPGYLMVCLLRPEVADLFTTTQRVADDLERNDSVYDELKLGFLMNLKLSTCSTTSPLLRMGASSVLLFL
uniref:Uncharacterized protein n=1 Tax=Oncorhynchus mykiss TaxID=8022 RepID=A0A8C7Q4C7_ONCMY